MHYTINYDGLNEADKQAKAMQDIKSYLGEKHFAITNELLAEEIKKGMEFEYFEQSIGMFLGIEGYPVQAWAKSLGLQIPEKTTH